MESHGFIPHDACAVASGECFYQSKCLRSCNKKYKLDLARRIEVLEEKIQLLEKRNKNDH